MTKIEKEISGLILRGYTEKEIANIRRVSMFTVHSQVRSLREKLNARNSTQLAVKIIENIYGFNICLVS